MHVVYLALGSNVGNTQEYIHQALSLLESKLTDIELATVYQTTAFGYENQDDFLNTALRAKTSLTAEELLVFVKDIEHQIGRKERFRWGPREIDIDILFYDTICMESEELTIPHIGIPERDFVLQPLCDISPDFIHPQLHMSMKELLQKIPQEKRTL